MKSDLKSLLGELTQLTSSERDLLSIISKTDHLTNAMLKDPQFSEDALRDLTTLLAHQLISVDNSSTFLRLGHPEELSEILHLHFLSLESNRRRHIAEEIAQLYLDRKLVVKALELLVLSGDREKLTEALMCNILDVHTPRSIDIVLEVTDLMVLDSEIRKFAQLAIKTTCHIWRGDYMLALQKLEQIRNVVEPQKSPSYMTATLEFLTGITNYFMGNITLAEQQLRNTLENAQLNQNISSAHLILVARIYASIGLQRLNKEIVQYSYEVGISHRDDSYSLYTIFNQVQIQAMKAYVEGDLHLALEKAAAAIEIADGGQFLGTQAPFDAVFIRASCLEENLNREVAEENWRRLQELSKLFNVPHYSIISSLKLIRYNDYENRIVAYRDSIMEMKHQISSLPYSSELQETIINQEVELLIELQEFELAKEAIQRMPHSPRRQIFELLYLREGLNLEDTSAENVVTPRIEISRFIAQMKDKSLSEVRALEIAKKLLESAMQSGFVKTLCNQERRIVVTILRASQQNIDVNTEVMARKLREFAKFSFIGSERTKLTSREMEILDLLNIGFGRMEICENLQIALNTFKTHQKHLYKKLNSRNREEVLAAAKKLGLISR